VAVAAIMGTVGGILIKNNWGYWTPPKNSVEYRVKTLEEKIAHLPTNNPETIQAVKALKRGNLDLAETLTNISDSLDIIERNCSSFYEGHYPDYQVVAGQLKKLLCNETITGNESLALKVFPNLKLHPMRNRITEETIKKNAEEARKWAPGVADFPTVWLPHTITAHPVKFIEIFNLKSDPIAINDWLSQIVAILGSKPFTIKYIIQSVAEQSGFTTDYLEASKKMWNPPIGGRTVHHHEPIIIGIGEYIDNELKRQIGNLRQIKS
jgi:hypothetical protein